MSSIGSSVLYLVFNLLTKRFLYFKIDNHINITLALGEERDSSLFSSQLLSDQQWHIFKYLHCLKKVILCKLDPQAS